MTENIYIIEYETNFGKYVAMFNKKVITEDVVKELIKEGLLDYYEDKVVVMTKKAYINLTK